VQLLPNKHYTNLVLPLIVVLISACVPNEGAIQTAIAQTQASWTSVPTSTSYPTHTPYPTQTQLPTLTPYPTYTPFPTRTRIPVGGSGSEYSEYDIDIGIRSFLDEVMERVFTEQSREAMIDLSIPELIALPGFDDILEFSFELTGPLVGFYAVTDVIVEETQILEGEDPSLVATYTITARFEQGPGTLTLLISKRLGELKIVGWFSQMNQ